MKNNIGIGLLLTVVLFFGSCGAKKKIVNPTSKVTTESNATAKDRTNIAAYYAQLLSVNENELDKNLYNFIDGWMGIRHQMGGMSKSGIDCSGFVNILFRQVYKIDLPRSSRDMAENIKRKYDDQLQEGDLVFFSFGGKQVDHVGIYLHNNKFVHVSTKQGVVISNLKDVWYYKYLTRCGTPKS